MSSSTINGQTFSGQSVSFINGTVIIDGVKQTMDKLQGVVRVEIKGDPANVTCDAPLVVTGDVKGNIVADGPVTCNDVGGNVDADGPVTAGNVAGDVRADGPVNCGKVGGKVVADMVMTA